MCTYFKMNLKYLFICMFVSTHMCGYIQCVYIWVLYFGIIKYGASMEDTDINMFFLKSTDTGGEREERGK